MPAHKRGSYLLVYFVLLLREKYSVLFAGNFLESIIGIRLFS